MNDSILYWMTKLYPLMQSIFTWQSFSIIDHINHIYLLDVAQIQPLEDNNKNFIGYWCTCFILPLPIKVLLWAWGNLCVKVLTVFAPAVFAKNFNSDKYSSTNFTLISGVIRPINIALSLINYCPSFSFLPK